MTEEEWSVCTYPEPMLRLLEGKSTERKMRLFLVACARLVWERMTDPTLRRGVETAERYADGLASSEEQETAHLGVYGLATDGTYFDDKASRMGISRDEYMSLFGLALSCGFSKKGFARIVTTAGWGDGAKRTGAAQPSLIRDIFGNPFRIASINPWWLTSTVINVAKAIYDERAFDRLPILADALEDAGCDNNDIIQHCRNEGPHVRGCWVVDLLLGKE